MMLLKGTYGYKMGLPQERITKTTHSLFIDDLQVYQQNHQDMKATNEILVTASQDTGAMHGAKKCTDVVLKRGKMVKGDGRMVLEERGKALDPGKNGNQAHGKRATS